jgi:hypothetical protein
MTAAAIPPRMFTSEVLKLARFGRASLNERRKQHTFPDPIDRGREDIYDGMAVYQALKLIPGPQQEGSGDRIMEALSKL